MCIRDRVSVLVLGIGISRHQSIGYWVLGAKLGIVLTLTMSVYLTLQLPFVTGILADCAELFVNQQHAMFSFACCVVCNICI